MTYQEQLKMAWRVKVAMDRKDYADTAESRFEADARDAIAHGLVQTGLPD